MILDDRKRAALFWFVFVGACLAAVSELFGVIWSYLKCHSLLSFILGLIPVGLLVSCASFLKQLFRRMFLIDRVTPERLQKLASARCAIISSQQLNDEYGIRQQLVTNTLRYSESWLRGWVNGSHLELSVFIDSEMPLMFAYFDSNHDTSSRSMAERAKNPSYYAQKGYQVVELLREATSQPVIFQDTVKKNSGYVFVTSRQREQIRSTILIRPDVAVPCALVLTSNQSRAFADQDVDQMTFIRYVAESVLGDLLEKGFVSRVRNLRPSLFGVS